MIALKKSKSKKNKKNFNNNIVYFGVSGLLLALLIGYGIYTFLIPKIDSVVISEATLLEDGSDSLSIDVGETDKLSCVYKGENISNYKPKWESDNPSIVNVDSNGNIFGVGAGKTTVSCQVKDKKSDIPVEVLEVNDTSKAASSYYLITKVGGKNKVLKYLFLTLGDKKQTQFNTSGASKNATYSIKDTSIATVNKNGVVVASSSKVGTTLLTIKIKNQTLKIPVIVRRKNESNIHALQVGGALATLFESKNGKYGLYDTGRHNVKKYDTCEKIKHYLNGLGVQELDFIVISHLHSDHYGCLTRILDKYKVNNLYIKDYPSSNWNASKSLREKVKKFKDAAKKNKANFNVVTVNSNSNFKLGEMNFELFNKEEVFSKYVANNGAGCNPTSKYKKKKLATLCSENANSLGMLMYVEGNARTSWNYFSGDIENQGIGNSKITVNGNTIRQVFGSMGKWYVKNYGGNRSKELYREDKTACTVRNYVAERTGKSAIGDCYSSASNMRKYIKTNKRLDTSKRVDIDVYQVSHHGLNNSLNVYSYLLPRYAYISNGEKSLTEKKVVGKTNEVGQTMYWPTFVGMNNNNVMITGRGTIIYSITNSGQMNTPIQLENVKNFDNGEDDIK